MKWFFLGYVVGFIPLFLLTLLWRPTELTVQVFWLLLYLSANFLIGDSQFASGIFVAGLIFIIENKDNRNNHLTILKDFIAYMVVAALFVCALTFVWRGR